ncbi:unnamed protein product, partial [Rotaria magnacalcarata]
MANLWSLSMLYLSNSKLTTLPVAIGKIKSLTCINLDNSTNICSIQSINGLPNLHMLSTLNCGITNILLNLPNICYLDMSNNRLTNLVGIKTLAQIQQIKEFASLRINNNTLADLPSVIYNITALVYLDIRNNLF